jgi:hypothetical protein
MPRRDQARPQSGDELRDVGEHGSPDGDLGYLSAI